MPAFADRLAALVSERESQICLGLDPEPEAADAVVRRCGSLIEAAGPACVAAKLQLACFERLGPDGWAALYEVAALAREAGLLVIADGKRGDVPVSAEAYAEALLGASEGGGLGADAVTVNPLLGRDALAPFIDAARGAGAGVFALVRTTNPGAAELQDEPAGQPLHERLAAMVAAASAELEGEGGLSGMGAVVGATAPQLIGRLRELMPAAIFLIPGVGAQGGRPQDLAAAFSPGAAAAIVAASRSIAGADDPGAAAQQLRGEVWSLSRD